MDGAWKLLIRALDGLQEEKWMRSWNVLVGPFQVQTLSSGIAYLLTSMIANPSFSKKPSDSIELEAVSVAEKVLPPKRGVDIFCEVQHHRDVVDELKHFTSRYWTKGVCCPTSAQRKHRGIFLRVAGV